MAKPLDSAGNPVHGGGTQEHGTVTIGLAAVLVQVKDDDIRSWMGKNKGPGNIFGGGAAVTASNTALELASGDAVVRDKSSDDLYLIADQVGTVVTFWRERAPKG